MFIYNLRIGYSDVPQNGIHWFQQNVRSIQECEPIINTLRTCLFESMYSTYNVQTIAGYQSVNNIEVTIGVIDTMSRLMRQLVLCLIRIPLLQTGMCNRKVRSGYTLDWSNACRVWHKTHVCMTMVNLYSIY